MSTYVLDNVARSIATSRTRRSLLKGFVGGLVIAVAGPIGFSDASASAGNEQFVLDYYDAIQKHSWKTAYNLLGAKFHRSQSLQQFTDGFASTAYTSVEIGHVTGQLNGNQVGVDVTINSWLSDGTPQAFSGRYFIGREGGVAKIVDAKIQVADASGLAPLCFAGDLAADLSGNAGTGHRYGDLVVINEGSACTLAGMPGVAIRDKNGKKLISGKRESNTTIQAVTLDPGQSALLQLDWTNWCGSAISGDVRVAISLPGSTGKFTIDHGFGVPPCLSDPNGASRLAIKPWQAQ